jgi:hypothetical protein
MNFKIAASVILIAYALGSCSPNVATATNLPATQPVATEPSNPNQPTATQINNEPTAIPNVPNPLTGLPVADPALLDLPALLVSISHFPATARPQAGLSFAPYVFEIYITEGATRFLTAFYGEFPAPEVPLAGNCDVRRNLFCEASVIVGNQVWHGANKNGIHEAWERGIEGCVNLYDASLNLLQQTTTDTNGYYGFNVDAGKYFVAFAKPDGMEFTQENIGDENQDSDVDQATGWTDALEVSSSSLLNVDVGLIPFELPPPTSGLAPAKVGPIRSGRLIYADIAAFLPDSCLIYAFASAEVLVELPKCYFVNHDVQGGGYMLDIAEMTQLIKDKETTGKIDYSSNLYSAEPPEGGVTASRLNVYIAWLNQSAWIYDPLYESWWRYVDTSDPQAPGEIHAEIDRLTKRQLDFENVIVLYAVHDLVSPTNLDIHLEQDWVGDALLFRDGKQYKIRWSTRATPEEVQSGRRKPIQFYYPDETTLFPLKPGHTWIIVVTPQTPVTEKKPGEWLLQFSQPPGAK